MSEKRLKWLFLLLQSALLYTDQLLYLIQWVSPLEELCLVCLGTSESLFVIIPREKEKGPSFCVT